MLLNGTIFVGSFMIWAGSAPHHTPSDIINDSYCTPQDWRKSWRPYHARTPCGQLQRQRETAKRLFRHITPSQLCILSVNNSLIRYDTCNMMMTNINFSDTLFLFLLFSAGFVPDSLSIYKNRGFLQTRQLHWGQHSSFFLQSQLSITDITESISDITEW